MEDRNESPPSRRQSLYGKHSRSSSFVEAVPTSPAVFLCPASPRPVESPVEEYTLDSAGATMPSQSADANSLAKELYDICDRFAEVAAQAERTGSSSIWEEVSGAFSTASLQSLLQPETSPFSVEWRRKMENFIGEQLEGRWHGKQQEESASPAPHPQHHMAHSSLGFGFQAPPATPASFLASGGMGPLAVYPGHDASNGSFTSGHSPTNSMDSPLLTATPYGPVPTALLSPFHFPIPGYFAPGINGMPVQYTPPTASNVPPPSFGELEVDHRWDMGLIDFANTFNGGPPAPQPPVLDQITRRPSPALPRLVTTDLSPSSAYNPSPTINISRSPTPEPNSETHGRSRSLSASSPGSPGRKAIHHRRLSGGPSSPGFHPYPTTPKTHELSLLSPDPSSLFLADSPGAALLSPSILMSEMALTSSPHSPASSNGDPPSRAGSHKRSRSSETRSRAARTIAYDENAVFIKNDQHVFVVHTQTRKKAEITEQDVLEIDLDSDPHSNAPTSALYRAVHQGLPYTEEVLSEDCRINASYAFTSTRAGATTHWLVTFSLDSSMSPPRPHTHIRPRTPQPNLPHDAAFTFVHFIPGTIVVSPTFPMGSSKWWRIQECPGRHENCPGDGSWTARWDEEGEERRPSRVVQHYASCSMRRADGDSFALGKLARAVRKVKGK